MGTVRARALMAGEQLDGDRWCCSLTCALRPAAVLTDEGIR